MHDEQPSRTFASRIGSVALGLIGILSMSAGYVHDYRDFTHRHYKTDLPKHIMPYERHTRRCIDTLALELGGVAAIGAGVYLSKK